MTESQKIIKEINDQIGIDVTVLVEMELVPVYYLKKWLVKRLYYDYAKTGMTYTDIKIKLSDEYGISISSIEKLIYRHRYGKDI